MEETMKMALWYGPGDVRIEERPMFELEEDAIIMKVKASLTCGTDVKTYKRGHPSYKPGISFGHEAAGIVHKKGSKVTGFEVGDRIVPHSEAMCGECYYCKTGRNDGCCEHRVRIKGGHSEYVYIPGPVVRQNTFHIPDDVSYKAAALTEPLACAMYGADMTKFSYGDTVVVMGAGPIGLMIALIIKRRGAHVIQADFSKDRLEVSRRLGIDTTVVLNQEMDIVRMIRNLTPQKRGADAVVDATGQPAAWENCIMIARKGGYINLFGGCKPGTKITIDTQTMHYGGLTIAAFFHTTPKHVMMANEMINHHEIPEDIFVTGEYRLENLIDALEAHANQQGIKNAIIYE